MSNQPCRVSALGSVSALGASVPHMFEALVEGAPSPLRESDVFSPGDSFFLGTVPDDLPECVPGLEGIWSRNVALSVLGLAAIREDIEYARETFGAERIGVVLGSSTSGIAEGEAAMKVREKTGSMPETFSYFRQEMGAVSEAVARYLGLRGPSYTISTACSSSAKVFRAGKSLLDLDMCDVVLVGGVDSLCEMTLRGFRALDVFSKNPCKPFSRNRDGISIGEGAAFFLLRREAGGVQLLGVGESSDAYHISSPEPEGRGAEVAMRAALERASISADEVDYLNLHGTGTIHNDSMEAAAVSRIFPDSILCSSTKPMFGHALGASGAIEAAVCVSMLNDFLSSGTRSLRLPVHSYDGEYDESISRISLIEKAHSITCGDRAVCVSNSFGFGGSNCSLVFAAERSEVLSQ